MPAYIAMDTAVCGNCAHFRQHYIKTGEQYNPLTYGHCVYPRRKKRLTGNSYPQYTPKQEPNS